MDVIEKSVEAAVKPVESDNPNGEFEVILSTEDLDRDKENLWIDEWKQPLPERIHIDGDHGRSIEKTVGSAVPRIEGNRMIGKGTFAGTEYAQMVRRLVNEGHINSVSVTYAESKNQKGDGVQRELLNAAFVAIPANPKAVVLSSKSKKEGDDKKPYGNVAYADPKNGKYPIDTAEHVRAAWSYINMPKNASDYSAAELSAIKDRIRRAAEKFGINIDTKKAFLDIVEQLYGGKAAGGMSASGNNPQVAKHDALVQAIHDAAYHLGAECVSYAEADPGTDEGANKTAAPGADKTTEIEVTTKSSSPGAGSPTESADEDTAAAADAAAAVTESADDAAEKAKAAEMKARAIAFLISKNIPQEDEG